jgi:addiction module HigA family antidote
MRMKNPAHPGLLVKDNLDDLGLSVASAAAGLGVTRQQLHRVISGKSAITPDMALRLEAALGGEADFWLRMQAAYDLAQSLVHPECRGAAITAGSVISSDSIGSYP